MCRSFKRCSGHQSVHQTGAHSKLSQRLQSSHQHSRRDLISAGAWRTQNSLCSSIVIHPRGDDKLRESRSRRSSLCRELSFKHDVSFEVHVKSQPSLLDRPHESELFSLTNFTNWQIIRNPRVSNDKIPEDQQQHHDLMWFNSLSDAINHCLYLQVAYGHLFNSVGHSASGVYCLYSSTLKKSWKGPAPSQDREVTSIT